MADHVVHFGDADADANARTPPAAQPEGASNFQGAFIRLVKEADMEGLDRLFGSNNRFNIDPNYPDENDRLRSSAVHICARMGSSHIDTLWVLSALAKRAELELHTDICDAEGHTAAHVAAHEDHADVIDLLHELGADLNMRTGQGEAAHAVERASASRGSRRAAAKAHDGALAPVHIAAERRNLAALAALGRAGCDLDAHDVTGATPMHFAARVGFVDVLRALAAGGADVDAPNAAGRTPAHVAAWHDGSAALEALADLGADLDARAEGAGRGRTAAHCAAQACAVGALMTLANRGCHVSVRDDAGETPAHVAVRAGSAAAVRSIARIGGVGAIGLGDAMGRTPLHLAVWEGKDTVLTAIVTQAEAERRRRRRRGREEQVPVGGMDSGEGGDGDAGGTDGGGGLDLDAVDCHGWTAAHAAAFNKRHVALRELARAGASVTELDAYAWTPAHLAAKHGHLRGLAMPAVGAAMHGTAAAAAAAGTEAASSSHAHDASASRSHASRSGGASLAAAAASLEPLATDEALASLEALGFETLGEHRLGALDPETILRESVGFSTSMAGGKARMAAVAKKKQEREVAARKAALLAMDSLNDFLAGRSLPRYSRKEPVQGVTVPRHRQPPQWKGGFGVGAGGAVPPAAAPVPSSSSSSPPPPLPQPQPQPHRRATPDEHAEHRARSAVPYSHRALQHGARTTLYAKMKDQFPTPRTRHRRERAAAELAREAEEEAQRVRQRLAREKNAAMREHRLESRGSSRSGLGTRGSSRSIATRH